MLSGYPSLRPRILRWGPVVDGYRFAAVDGFAWSWEAQIEQALYADGGVLLPLPATGRAVVPLRGRGGFEWVASGDEQEGFEALMALLARPTYVEPTYPVSEYFEPGNWELTRDRAWVVNPAAGETQADYEIIAPGIILSGERGVVAESAGLVIYQPRILARGSISAGAGEGLRLSVAIEEDTA